MRRSRSSTASWASTMTTSANPLARWIWAGALALAWATGAQPATRSLGGGGPDLPAVNPATLQDLPPARAYSPPPGVVFKATDFSSENVRLTAQWFYAAGNERPRLPTIVMAPGWGATAASLRDDAVAMAREGYLVMVFDYRGWGDSDGRLAGTGRELRGYVDPFEQAQDWFNAVSYAATAPMVDPAHIGLLGSDLAGGHVIEVAASDPRVKALASLVTRADTRPSKPYDPDPAKVVADAYAQASRLAAGQAPYPAGGAPVAAKIVRWAPVDEADQVTAPALFVLAQDEELFSNTFNGQRACERVQGPRKMVLLPKITHYGIYGAEHQRATEAAIDWFDRYLKTPGAATRVPIHQKEPERGLCNPPPVPPKGEEPKDGSGAGHKAQDASGRWN